MKVISIRDVRGSTLEKYARAGELVGIQNYGALIGVIVPLTQNWVEHLIEYNSSRLQQSLAESEKQIASDQPMATLDASLAEAVSGAEHSAQQPAGQAQVAATGEAPEGFALPASVLQTLPPALLKDFGAAVLGTADELGEAAAAPRIVRVGDLSGGLIQAAGEAGHTLALTHDRVLIGILVPVTSQLVGFLIEENISRVLYNISLSEKEIRAGEVTPLTTERSDAGKPFG
ncbi:hypothetical protein ABZW18_32775 [Streptomyces sp. NPDC004647]|uniref:hypothetical protein n=1 Tax=Streptomyces sp. NPDC004647 TaxID=3154671 RepID=UPI0033A37CD7